MVVGFGEPTYFVSKLALTPIVFIDDLATMISRHTPHAVYDRAKIVIIISQCRGISIAEAEIIFESDYKHNFTQVKARSPVLADPTQITKV